MDSRVKQLWLDALESGEYSQGKGALRRTDGFGNVSYCCLGVLCDVAEKDGLTLNKSKAVADIAVWDDDLEAKDTTYNGNSSFLPYAVMKWAGLEENDGKFANAVHYEEDGEDPRIPYDNNLGGTSQAYNLIGLNDEGGFTFEQIADVIRERF